MNRPFIFSRDQLLRIEAGLVKIQDALQRYSRLQLASRSELTDDEKVELLRFLWKTGHNELFVLLVTRLKEGTLEVPADYIMAVVEHGTKTNADVAIQLLTVLAISGLDSAEGVAAREALEKIVQESTELSEFVDILGPVVPTNCSNTSSTGLCNRGIPTSDGPNQNQGWYPTTSVWQGVQSFLEDFPDWAESQGYVVQTEGVVEGDLEAGDQILYLNGVLSHQVTVMGFGPDNQTSETAVPYLTYAEAQNAYPGETIVPWVGDNQQIFLRPYTPGKFVWAGENPTIVFMTIR